MKRTTKYVAFDVHRATTVASVRDHSGRVLARSALETHGPSIVEFLCGMRGGQSRADRSPGQQSRRGTRLTLGPLAEPEEASARLRAESQIEPWFASRERDACMRPAGHDVYSATEAKPGAADLRLLERAIREDRLIVTFDRDFGELAVRRPNRPAAGVLLLRISPKSANQVTRLLLDLLRQSDV